MPRAGRRAVRADVERERARLVRAAPAEQAHPPREVGVRCPPHEILVEHLPVDGALLERRAAVERDRPVRAEGLAGRVVRQRGPAVPHQPVLAPPVHDHAGRVEQVEAVALLRAGRPDELRCDDADGRIVEPGAGGLDEARRQEAVRLHQEHGVAACLAQGGVHRAAEVEPLGETHAPHPVLACDLGGRVGRGVVADDDLDVWLRQDRWEATAQELALVRADDGDGDPHATSSRYTAAVWSAASSHVNVAARARPRRARFSWTTRSVTTP